MRPVCYQVNFQETLGGGEIYTRCVAQALQELGWRTLLFVHPRAGFWQDLLPAGSAVVPAAAMEDVESRLEGERPLVLTHVMLSAGQAGRLSRRAILAGMVHMPLYERLPEGLAHYAVLYGVSEHVLASMRARGLANVHPAPLYGIADLAPRAPQSSAAIRAASPYEWDRRKARDRLYGRLQPLAARLAGDGETFRRRPGPTLGIVSRITPIKQFPLMFGILAPVLARFPQVGLEIFGSGGYASVRDLRRALDPARDQVRWWGQQADVARIYPQLDYVLSGLPEKEALGLNLLEAQASGTPVLAVNAPPFTETVRDCETGFLYEDPRNDGGAGFARLLEGIAGGRPRPDPLRARDHLRKFSKDAFAARLSAALSAACALH